MDRETMIEEAKKAKAKRKMKLIAGGILAAIVIAVGGFVWINSASFQREMKSFTSDVAGGLDRTVTVYDNNGNILREYSGKIDIKENDYGNKVIFDLDGERITIYNAVVISEETK